MFTINFWKTVGVEKLGVYEGTHWYTQQVKFPYVPRIGESIKFPEDKVADEELEALRVEDVILNIRTREFDVHLESFVYDAADVDDGIELAEATGIRLFSYEPEESEDTDVV